MEYRETITLKDGRACVIRQGTADDAEGVLRNFVLNHAQTDFLTTYPDEIPFTVEQEAKFLQGKADADSLPDNYRAQLLKAINQYRAEMLDKHNGLNEVQVSDNVARRDTSLNLTYANILLCYGDSTEEEITVPMVERDGRWLMN